MSLFTNKLPIQVLPYMSNQKDYCLSQGMCPTHGESTLYIRHWRQLWTGALHQEQRQARLCMALPIIQLEGKNRGGEIESYTRPFVNSVQVYGWGTGGAMVWRLTTWLPVPSYFEINNVRLWGYIWGIFMNDLKKSQNHPKAISCCFIVLGYTSLLHLSLLFATFIW